jgi:hypothetical protein
MAPRRDLLLGDRQDARGPTRSRLQSLLGATPEVCPDLRSEARIGSFIPDSSREPREKTPPYTPVPSSCQQFNRCAIHSIPIDSGPASLKSSYRKCSGDQTLWRPQLCGAGVLPIEPKDFWPD